MAETTLKGSVQQSVEIPDFTEVVIKGQANAWNGVDQTGKNQVADAFFNKHIATQAGYNELDDNGKLELRTAFNKKHGIGQIQDQPGILDDINKGLTATNLAIGSVTGPAIDRLTFGLTDHSAQRQEAAQQFPGIATDPGLLGDAYRLNTNPALNFTGNMLGTLTGAGRIAQAIGKNPLASLPTVGKLPALVRQSGLTALGFSAPTNAVDILRGRQNPLEAVFNTAADVVTAPINGVSRFGNAVKQGAAGAVTGGASSVVSDVTRGQPIDWQRAYQAAMREAAVSAGLGGAMGGDKPISQPLKAKVYSPGAMLPANRFTVAPASQYDVDPTGAQFRQSTNNQLQQAQTKVSVDEQSTMRAQVNALKSLYEKLAQVANNPAGDRRIGSIARSSLSRVKQAYDAKRAEYDQRFPNANQQNANKRAIKGVPNAEQHYNRLVDTHERMVVNAKPGRQKQAARTFWHEVSKRYNKDEVQRIKDRIADRKALREAEANKKTEAAALRRKQGRAKVETIAEQRREAKRKQNELIKSELEKQEQELLELKPGKLIAQEQGGATKTPFAKTKDGKEELGRIDRPETRDKGMEPLPIKMHEGNENYGREKIERKHASELEKAGFKGDAPGFVQEVLKHHDFIGYDPNNRSIVIAVQFTHGRRSQSVAIELIKSADGKYYSVKSAGLFSKGVIERSKVIWERRYGSTGSDSDSLSSSSSITSEDGYRQHQSQITYDNNITLENAYNHALAYPYFCFGITTLDSRLFPFAVFRV